MTVGDVGAPIHGEDTPAGRAYQAALLQGTGAAASVGAKRLAEAVRRLITVTTGSSCTDDELAGAAAKVEALVEDLRGGQRTSRYPHADISADMVSIFPTHPVVGPANAVAPPLVPEIEGARLRLRVTYGPQYEGPNNFVHGGHIAAGFDGVVAITGGANGAGGLTRSLKVRYRRPAPTNTELVYEGWVASSDERTTHIHGVLRHGDEICAEVEGECARPRPRPVQ